MQLQKFEKFAAVYKKQHKVSRNSRHLLIIICCYAYM